MKRINYLLATAAILAVVGCAKEAEKEIVNPESNMVTLRASVEDTDTRVSIGNDYAFAFQSGDKVSVLTDGGEPVEFETSDSGATASFEGSLGEGESVGSYALYPASDNHMADGDEVLFYMNEELTWKADESYMPMLGKVEDGSITFKAVGGVMKLIVYNIPSGAAYLQFTATNKKISGDFEIADASVDNPVIVTATKNASDDTMFIDFSEDYSVNKVFYIPLPTGTIDGFTISFLDGNFDDIEGASKTTTANLTVTRNKIILAPALNMAPAEEVVLWSDNFTTSLSGEGSGDLEVVTIAAYNNEKGGQSVNSGTVNYTKVGNTSLYKNANLAGGDAGELFLAKKDNNGTDGSFTATGIEPGGARSAVLSFLANNTAATNVSVSSTTSGVSFSNRAVSGKAVSYSVSINAGIESFNIVFTNSSSKNTRIDNIVLKATVGSAPATPSITVNKDSETISAGALKASITGVKLVNALDNLGISATSNQEWLSVAFTEGSFESGSKLTATANSYNHDSAPRYAVITLKATGAASKTITFIQNPSVVNNPTLTTVPGINTFTVSWTGDSKVKEYEGYYSNQSDLADPTSATPLEIVHEGLSYSATPSGSVVNGTKYYIYVRVGELGDDYAGKYAVSSTWSTESVTPNASKTVSFVYSSLYSEVSESESVDGESDTVEDITIAYAQGNGSNPPMYYKNGSALRLYSNNTLTFTGGTIKKVSLTFNTSNYANAFAGNDSSLSVSNTVVTWEGSSSNLVITAHGTSRCNQIVVTYE